MRETLTSALPRCHPQLTNKHTQTSSEEKNDQICPVYLGWTTYYFYVEPFTLKECNHKNCNSI